MTGGRGRSTAPRELAGDPERWPDAVIPHPQARVIQSIAREVVVQLERQGLSLRRLADLSGVNRQVIANLIAGGSWVDVATVSRLEDALGIGLYPGTTGPGSGHA